jgi:Domain of unknown function (DUF4157)
MSAPLQIEVKVRTKPYFAPAQTGLLQRKCACGNHTMSGECEECKSKQGMFQRASLSPRGRGSEGQGEVPPIVHEVLRSPGRPLDPATRAFMEPRFGHDFSQVRVHTDAKAAESARTVNALAYTLGRDLVFGANQYAPRSFDGQRLLAHELTHVVQQQHTTPANFQIAPPHDTFEQEADSVASGFNASTVRVQGALTSPALQRQPPLPQGEPKQKPGEKTATNAPAVREVEKCEEFPGGSTDCEVDQTTGTPTGKVTHRIDETNPCTRPCVEQHEAVHVKQLKTFCPQLRDCYLAADKGKRPIEECVKIAIFATRERECAAYKVSVPCVEKRIKTAKECQSAANKEYGTRKLTSEKCFRDKNCGSSASK